MNDDSKESPAAGIAIITDAQRELLKLLERDVTYRGESVNLYAQAGLRSLMLINGGAIVALLTFIGNAKTELNPAAIRLSFMFFGLGIILGMIAHVIGYFSQNIAFGYAQSMMATIIGQIDGQNVAHPTPIERTVNTLIIVAIIAATLSLAFFALGAWQALNGILTENTSALRGCSA